MNSTNTTRLLILAQDKDRGKHLCDMVQSIRRNDQISIASTPEEALRTAKEQLTEVAIVEGKSGLLFIEAAASLDLNVVVLFIAPDDDGDMIDQARVAGASETLFHSELTPGVLSQTIHHALLWRTEDSSNNTTDRSDEHAILQNLNRTESIARFVAGIAHEVRNPLSLVTLAADLIDRPRPLSDATRATIASHLRDCAQRIDKMMDDMLNAYAPRLLARSHQPTDQVIEDALLAEASRIQLTPNLQVIKELAPDLPALTVDKGMMTKAFSELIANAIDAMPKGGELVIRAYTHQFKVSERADWQREAWFWAGDTAVIIEIADTGSGIPADKMNYVYDAFFTTKAAGKGTGLGLTAAKKIVELHNGLISLTNQPTGGVMAKVTLKTASPNNH